MSSAIEANTNYPESATSTDNVDNRQQDSRWILGFYGTAIGAGTLFLPIDAGINGLLPLIFMIVLALPMTFYSHRALCRFVLASRNQNSNITDVVEEFFGHRAGVVLTFLYFLSIFPILLMYGVAIVNTVQSFLAHQLGIVSIARSTLSFVIMGLFFLVIRLGLDKILKFMSMLVYPFIASLIFISLFLIPHWHSSVMVPITTGHKVNTLMTLWMIIPVIIFSFNHSPIISAFAVSQKKRYGDLADIKSAKILKVSQILMVSTVILFVLSCVFSLSPGDLAIAKHDNVSILTYIANYLHNPWIAFIAPIVAIVAITKSFFGHYIGAKEGLHGLLVKTIPRYKNSQELTLSVEKAIEIIMIITCWVMAMINPNILTMIESVSGPAIAIILFILPMYAVLKIPAMYKYRNKITDPFIWTTGIVAISAIFYPALKHLF